jgi:hypothetical protein
VESNKIAPCADVFNGKNELIASCAQLIAPIKPGLIFIANFYCSWYARRVAINRTRRNGIAPSAARHNYDMIMSKKSCLVCCRLYGPPLSRN